MSTPFAADYEPPFPQLLVILQFDQERLGPFAALLDTGADVTFVPSNLLNSLRAWKGERAFVRTHFGESQPVRLYLVDVQINSVLLPGIYVVGNETNDEIILGRDVLNKLPLFLDGPAQQTEILDNAAVKRIRVRRK